MAIQRKAARQAEAQSPSALPEQVQGVIDILNAAGLRQRTTAKAKTDNVTFRDLGQYLYLTISVDEATYFLNRTKGGETWAWPAKPRGQRAQAEAPKNTLASLLSKR